MLDMLWPGLISKEKKKKSAPWGGIDFQTDKVRARPFPSFARGKLLEAKRLNKPWRVSRQYYTKQWKLPLSLAATQVKKRLQALLNGGLSKTRSMPSVWQEILYGRGTQNMNRKGTGQWKRAAQLSLAFEAITQTLKFSTLCSKQIELSPGKQITPAVFKRTYEATYVWTDVCDNF